MGTWALRLLAAGIVVAGFNYWLYNSSPAQALATQRYAKVLEYTYTNYTGVKGYIYTGNPSPVLDGHFSNQTLWAINNTYCAGAEYPGSWIEVGWTKWGSSAPIYKFNDQLPQFGCVYNDISLGNPVPGSWHLYELQCASSCSSQSYWNLTLDGVPRVYVATGWTNGRAREIHAGGEVSMGGNAMEGSISLMQYKRGSTWYVAGLWEWERCDYGYNLQYTTLNYDSIATEGFTPPGICDVRPK
jgi:hypothetical protein